MGWSASTKAIMVLSALFGDAGAFRSETALLKLFGNSSNTWIAADGTHYFYETGRENRDGAVTGTVWKMLSEGRARRTGTFRIDPDGKVVRFSGIPAATLRKAEGLAADLYNGMMSRVGGSLRW